MILENKDEASRGDASGVDMTGRDALRPDATGDVALRADATCDDAPGELWDVRTASGAVTGRTHRRGSRMREGDFHLVCCVAVQRADGRILMSRRAAGTIDWPGTWELPGGSALAGESSAAAARRELVEEVGVRVEEDGLELVGRSVEGSALVDLYLARIGGTGVLDLDPAEVASAAWRTPEEMIAAWRDGEMAAPWTQRLERLGAALLAALARPTG